MSIHWDFFFMLLFCKHNDPLSASFSSSFVPVNTGLRTAPTSKIGGH